MPKIKIDGFEFEVENGTTVLNAARMIGGDIVPPAMCYYSKLEGSAENAEPVFIYKKYKKNSF